MRPEHGLGSLSMKIFTLMRPKYEENRTELFFANLVEKLSF
jgi:hypothetical protein